MPTTELSGDKMEITGLRYDISQYQANLGLASVTNDIYMNKFISFALSFPILKPTCSVHLFVFTKLHIFVH